MLIELTLNVCTTRLAIDHQFAISCDVPFEQFLASLAGCRHRNGTNGVIVAEA
jgi:hypothetical protein